MEVEKRGAIIQKIINFYVNEMGLKSICRVVQTWIKTEGKEFKQPDISEEKFISYDKIWIFVQKGHQ